MVKKIFLCLFMLSSLGPSLITSNVLAMKDTVEIQKATDIEDKKLDPIKNDFNGNGCISFVEKLSKMPKSSREEIIKDICKYCYVDESLCEYMKETENKFRDELDQFVYNYNKDKKQPINKSEKSWLERVSRTSQESILYNNAQQRLKELQERYNSNQCKKQPINKHAKKWLKRCVLNALSNHDLDNEKIILETCKTCVRLCEYLSEKLDKSLTVAMRITNFIIVKQRLGGLEC